MPCPFYRRLGLREVVCEGKAPAVELSYRFEDRASRDAWASSVCHNGVACMDCGLFRVLRGDFVNSDAGGPSRGWRL